MASTLLLAGLLCMVASGCSTTTTLVVRDGSQLDPTSDDAAKAEETLKDAHARLEKLFGHRVEIAFEAAMMPQDDWFIPGLINNELGELVLDLERLAKQSPEQLSHYRDRLRTITIDYDGARNHEQVKFELDKARVRLVLTSRRIPPSLLSRAMRRHYHEKLAARLRDVAPEAVASQDLQNYFEVQTEAVFNGSTSFRRAPAAAASASLKRDALVLERLIRFEARLNDGPLRTSVQRWLAERVRYLGRVYLASPHLGTKVPTSWKRAEKTYLRWLNERLGGLDDELQQGAFDGIFRAAYQLRRHNQPDGFSRGGLDVVQAALRVVDRWRAAGHPSSAGNVPARQALFRRVLAPLKRGQRVSMETTTSLVAYASGNVRARRRLLAAIIKRADPRLTETVFVHLLEEQRTKAGREALRYFWRGTMKRQPSWRVASQVIVAARRIDPATSSWFYKSMPKIWKAKPRRRGCMLYVLAHLNRYEAGSRHYDLLTYDQFAETFGAKISSRTLTDYLRCGPAAIEPLAHLLPALQHSLANSLVPQLDALLDARTTAGARPALERLFEALRRAGLQADVARIHSQLRTRLRRRPAERRDLEVLLRASAPRAQP